MCGVRNPIGPNRGVARCSPNMTGIFDQKFVDYHSDKQHVRSRSVDVRTELPASRSDAKFPTGFNSHRQPATCE